MIGIEWKCRNGPNGSKYDETKISKGSIFRELVILRPGGKQFQETLFRVQADPNRLRLVKYDQPFPHFDFEKMFLCSALTAVHFVH